MNAQTELSDRLPGASCGAGSRTYRLPRVLHTALILLFIWLLIFNATNAGELRGTEWTITPGDTLYAIGRSLYPGDTRAQARLREDIRRLNPVVFASGANNMKIGTVLKLPGYIADRNTAGQAVSQPQAKPTPKTSAPVSPAPAARGFSGSEWIVKKGDTLYAIGRAIYPADVRRQSRLREDIVKLNPFVFANGANNMVTGIVLRLPDYVGAASVVSSDVEPMIVAPAPAPAPVEVTQAPAAPPIAPVAEPEPKAPAMDPLAPASSAKIESAAQQPVSVNRRSNRGTDRTSGGMFVSLGYSFGGDMLVDIVDGPDIDSGSGIQARLGYERMPQFGGGYRLALGFQYDTAKDTSYRNTYLSLAYQYRQDPIVYGIGIVAHPGPELKVNGTSTDFDAAYGVTAYLENVGSGALAGWGLSYTTLDYEAEDSNSSIDASRAEIYYGWKF